MIPRAFLYERFKKALADYRAIEANGGWPSVPAGPTLRPGGSDERVPALAARLAVTGDLPADFVPRRPGRCTTGRSSTACGIFRRGTGSAPDGIVGAATLAELNVPVAARVEQIRANLERARWVFYDPESEFLVVNIAGFRLYLLRRGEVVWRTRVQVGRPYRQTPIFKAEMTYLVVNPTWTVPPAHPPQRHPAGGPAQSRLSRLAQYRALRSKRHARRSGHRGLVRAAAFRTASCSGPARTMRSAASSSCFRTSTAVYLHDTPSRDLFDRDSRAFSSGCIRVENPFELAEQLLGARGRASASTPSSRAAAPRPFFSTSR